MLRLEEHCLGRSWTIQTLSSSEATSSCYSAEQRRRRSSAMSDNMDMPPPPTLPKKLSDLIELAIEDAVDMPRDGV